jgi:hypothetical protein
MSFMKSGVLTLALVMTMAGAQAQQASPKPSEPRVPLRNLNEMIEKARADLAVRLGGKVAEITVAGWTSVHLPARVLHCEVTKGDEGEPTVPGYRIVLVFKARDYTYHSDTQTVTACPRIEAS